MRPDENEPDPADAEGRPGDEAPPEEPSSGENICPDCGGSGTLQGGQCQTCLGTGRINEAIGGG